ncbi:MAG: GNAT family N-acetyltransferase [Ignavibacteria bacterium]|nr:GNAT family N-acetyltransferase [Ignavibacteria bacterium]
MTSIIKAKEEDCKLLADIGKVSFIESHGSSAASSDIDMYVNDNYNSEILKEEISDRKNIYHIIYHDNQPAGYSKIIYNVPHSNIGIENVTKLDRIYLLKEFYGLRLGLELFNFNIELSRQNKQSGMWLFVWKENHRAVNFYKKTGFKIVGSYDFKLTDTHSNPNHQMLLMY